VTEPEITCTQTRTHTLTLTLPLNLLITKQIQNFYIFTVFLMGQFVTRAHTHTHTHTVMWQSIIIPSASLPLCVTSCFCLLPYLRWWDWVRPAWCQIYSAVLECSSRSDPGRSLWLSADCCSLWSLWKCPYFLAGSKQEKSRSCILI